MTMMKGLLAATVSLACLTAAGSAHAAVTISFDQVGDDVVATTTGTFDRTLSQRRGNSFVNNSYVYASIVTFTSGALGVANQYDLTGAVSIGPGAFYSRTSKTSGTTISLSPQYFGISANYVDNSAIFATSVFTDTTIEALGLTPASYNYAAGGNSVTLNVNAAVAAVPEPATWAMMLVGFGMVGATARYRRRKSSTVYG